MGQRALASWRGRLVGVVRPGMPRTTLELAVLVVPNLPTDLYRYDGLSGNLVRCFC